MAHQNKVFLVVVGLMILIGVGSHIYDRKVCDPKREVIERKIDHLRQSGPVKKIELVKEKTGYETNLIDDSILITDSVVIEEIRAMIIQKYIGTWNHPTAKWSVLLRITDNNNESLDFKVSKISNDRDSSMTHMYFGVDGCGDSFPSCSLALGTYLEALTGYEGRNYY